MIKLTDGSHFCQTRSGRRRGFLLVDALAGTALAVLALGMMIYVLSADMKIRRQQQQGQQLLLSVENVIHRLEGVPYAELTLGRVQGIAGEYKKQAGADGLHFELKLVDLPGEPAGRRLVVQGRVSKESAGSVTLWRDRYPMGPGK